MPKSAFTVAEFCESHGRMSRTLFYSLVKEGKGPRLMKIGRRTLVSQEAAADWRRAMESSAQSSIAAAA